MPSRTTDRVLLALAFLGFVGLGMPDGLLGVAAPGMRADFHVGVGAMGSLLVAFMAGYVLSTVASGRAVARMGVGVLLAASCGLTGTSLLGYAGAPGWWVLVALAPFAGLGAGAIDAGLNTFAATHYGPRQVAWLHACYGLGTASGPAMLTALLAAGGSWRIGYAIVAALQLGLALAFVATRDRWGGGPAADAVAAAPSSLAATLRLPSVWLGAATFFLYTGIEAGVGLWAYSLLTEVRAVAPATAGVLTSAYWTSFTVSRLAAGAVVPRLGVTRLLRACLLAIPLGALVLWVASGAAASGTGLVLLGAACAPVFPALVSATPARVGGAHTANAIGVQIAAATLGQQLLPAFMGVLAARAGLAVCPPALLVSGVALLGTHEALALVVAAAARRPAPRARTTATGPGSTRRSA